MVLVTATIPGSKSAAVKTMNYYRPVALTMIIMKCLEQLVMVHLRNNTDIIVDLHQYAYRKNHFTSDAVSSVTQSALGSLHYDCSFWISVLLLTPSSRRL